MILDRLGSISSFFSPSRQSGRSWISFWELLQFWILYGSEVRLGALGDFVLFWRPFSASSDFAYNVLRFVLNVSPVDFPRALYYMRQLHYEHHCCMHTLEH